MEIVMAEETLMQEEQSGKTEVKKKSNTFFVVLAVSGALGLVLLALMFLLPSLFSERMCNGLSKESQVSLTKEDIEGVGWSLARSFASSLGLRDDFNFNYNPEEIQVIINASSFCKDKDQRKQLRELMEKSNNGKLTSEERKLAKKFKAAEKEIYKMITKKHLIQMFCELKKY